MTRLLWISKETPDPLGQGGQRRQYFQIRELVRAGVLVTAVLARGDQDPTAVSSLAEVRQFGGRLSRLRALTSPGRHLRSERYEGVVIAHAESFELISDVADAISVPALLDFQNVNSRWYRGLGDHERVEYWDREEASIMATMSAVLTCSEVELAALPSGRARGAVAPNGVDLGEWPWVQAARVPHRLAAFGSWWYPSNRKGLEWFLAQVWPLIRIGVPDAHLQLAGSGVPPIGSAIDYGVEHVGRVSDIAGFLRSASVIVMPVIDSPGTPVKFAEALAAGTPLVATTGAGDGFPDAPAAMTDDPEVFADACLALLGSAAGVEHAAGEARSFAERRCQWAETQLPLVEWATSLGGRS